MLFLETFYFLVSSLLLYPVGRVFFKELDFIFQYLFGLLVAGLILSFTARFYPIYSREILAILSIASIFILLVRKRNISSLFFQNSRKNIKETLYKILLFVFIYFIFLFLLREFSPLLWLYESHDVHIFGPTIELFNSNYIGNLKNPILFPSELSAYHILPGTFLGAANFLNPEINLVTLINSKYIIVSLIFSYGFFKIISQTNFSFLPAGIGIILLFFFKETIGYNLSISSYLYQVVLILIATVFFEINSKPENKYLEEAFIGLFMILVCIKIPIFYAILPALLFLFFKDPKIFFQPRLFFIGVLCLMSLIAIVAIPQSKEVAEITRYSLINIFEPDSIRSIAGLWFVENRFIDIFSFLNIELLKFLDEKYTILLLKLSYIFIFYFGLSFIALSFFTKSKITKALKIYLFTAILGWIFVRNNGNLDQQNHLFFNISILSTMLFLGALSFSNNLFLLNKKNILFFMILVFSITDLSNISSPKISGKSLSYRQENSISLSEFRSLSIYEYQENYIYNVNIPFWKNALISQMRGQRIYYKDLLDNNIDYEAYHLSQYSLK